MGGDPLGLEGVDEVLALLIGLVVEVPLVLGLLPDESRLVAWQRKFFKINPGQLLLKELMKYYEIINFRTSSSYFSRETRGDLE